MSNILLVEDDSDLIISYSDALKRAGFHVTVALDSTTALKQYDIKGADLAILDIMLGSDSEGGFNLCAELRKRSETLPIIFFTSLDSEFDKISGMRLGADDYITKDISIDYLLVRIKALLRRVSILSGQNKEVQNVLGQGELTINLDTLTASWKNKSLKLNITQIWMLIALAKNKNGVRTVAQLMEAANIIVQPNTVTMHMMSIRKAFRDIDNDFDAIKSERGIGYRWISE